MADEPVKSVLIALADAVVAAINSSGILPIGSAAERRFAPVVDLAVVKELLLLHVLPISDSEGREGGSGQPIFTGDYELDVVFYQRVGTGAAAEPACAALMGLRQELRDLFKSRQIVASQPRHFRAVLAEIKGEPAYSELALLERHCCVSNQTLKYRVFM